jgi:hypothetical protein
MRKAFEAFMTRQRIQRSDWWLYYPFWRAGANWQKKQEK